MSILNNPLYRPLLELIRTTRNGMVYGGKIRFSHALVMSILYKSGPIKPRIMQVLKATRGHAEVLAAFAFIYKIIKDILAADNIIGSSKISTVKFIAGAVASWVVYLQHFNLFNGGITHQVTLYCFSRVLLATGKILLDQYLNCRQPILRRANGEKMRYRDLSYNQQIKLKQFIYNSSWKYFAVLTWALVMVIYDTYPQYLQSSLRHSMAYIYDVEMSSWSSWKEFLGL